MGQRTEAQQTTGSTFRSTIVLEPIKTTAHFQVMSSPDDKEIVSSLKIIQEETFRIGTVSSDFGQSGDIDFSQGLACNEWQVARVFRHEFRRRAAIETKASLIDEIRRQNLSFF